VHDFRKIWVGTFLVVASDSLSCFEALVPAELASVVAARRLVEGAARAWGIAGSVAEDAALVMSELVTNAVLHAGTEVQVVVRRLGQGLRLEVGDGSSRLPPIVGADRPEDLLSTRSMTGRGLAVVAATVDRWGADSVVSGKVTWAEVGTGQRHAVIVEAPVMPAAVAEVPQDPSALWAGVTAVTAVAAEGRRVHLVGVPVRLLIESARQLADLRREIQFLGLGQDGTAELLDLAETSREISSHLDGLPDPGRAEAALARGESLMDLDVDLPDEVVRAFDRLGTLVQQVGENLGSDHLLAVPASEEVTAYRRWCRDEITAQLTGEPPRPCPFTAAAAP
jgi:anti-sigma regulatory factor (Ser/Thr protein kinase)